MLKDPTLKFDSRSAVDLKDRSADPRPPSSCAHSRPRSFRTYFPDAYKQHYPNAQFYRTQSQSQSPPRLAPVPPSSRRSASIAPLSNDDDAIRCVCGVPEDDGFSIACDVCSRWCHAACFGIAPGAVPGDWRCWRCAPTQPHDAAWARRLQLDRLARLVAEPPPPPPGTEEGARQRTTSPDVERGRKKERDGAGAAGQKTNHDHASGVDAGGSSTQLARHNTADGLSRASHRLHKSGSRTGARPSHAPPADKGLVRDDAC
jgi:hypothetical protein